MIPFAPRVGFPQQQQVDPNSVDMLTSLIGSLQQSYDSMGQPQQMAPEPVPNPINPYASMAAVFASTLADQLGARGSAENIHQQIGQYEQNRQAAQLRNRALEQSQMHDRQIERINLQQQLTERKAELAKRLGNLEDVDKANAQLMRLEDLKFKHEQMRDEKLHQYNMELAGLKGDLKGAGGGVGGTPSNTAEARLGLQFTNQIKGIYGNKAFQQSGKEGGVPLVHWWGTEKKPINDAGLNQVRGIARTTALTAPVPSLRSMALQTYAETLRKPDGTFDAASPVAKQFWDIVQQSFPDLNDQGQIIQGVIPDQNERIAFLKSVGYLP